jgi:hypothetical protein
MGIKPFPKLANIWKLKSQPEKVTSPEITTSIPRLFSEYLIIRSSNFGKVIISGHNNQP